MNSPLREAIDGVHGKSWPDEAARSSLRAADSKFYGAASNSLLRLGRYRHWKGHHYLVLFVARDSNNTTDHEPVVVYVSLDDPWAGSVNVRRLAEFTEEVDLPDGGRAPRFVYVGPAPG